ncbi:hypothetical protein DFH09DRAFT_1112308 [Mycena vulgaris]|nr:hypothetical protein DFH09DRAFT_1112308 [Mycena vulgaris]
MAEMFMAASIVLEDDPDEADFSGDSKDLEDGLGDLLQDDNSTMYWECETHIKARGGRGVDTSSGNTKYPPEEAETQPQDRMGRFSCISVHQPECPWNQMVHIFTCP